MTVGPMRGTIVAAVLTGLPVGAVAQVVLPQPVQDLNEELAAPEKVSVGERRYDEFAPLGIRVGTFTVSPDLQLGTRFESNIYGSHQNIQSDVIFEARPEVRVVSNWSNHFFGIYGSGNIQQYAAHPKENVGDAVIQAQGRLDVRHDQYLTGAIGYQSLSEPRYFRDAQVINSRVLGPSFGIHPLEYTVQLAQLGYVYRPGRFGYEIDTSATSYHFDNQPLINGRTQINSFRNRTDYTVGPRISYDLLPGYQAFAIASANERVYRTTTDSTPLQLQRSSSGFSVALGTQLDLGRVITGTVDFGYAKQRYQDSRLAQTDGPFFDLDFLWNVTQSTSLRLDASRSIQDSLIGTAVGIWDTRVKAGIEYEFAPSVIGTASFGGENLDYLHVNLTDYIASASSDIRWTLNRTVSLGAGLEWRHRWSNQVVADFDQEIASVNIRIAQ